MATERRAVALSTYTSIHVYADETEVDTANNRSYVATSLYIYVTRTYAASNVNTNVTGSSPYTNSYLSLGAGWHLLASGGFWQTHNNDGTGSAVVGSYYSSGYGTMDYGEFTIELSTIPRATTPSCGTGTFGQNLTINTPRASSGFTHTLEYWYGNAKGTIATNVGTSYTWTIPMDLEKQIPNASYGDGTITCTTYSGGTVIGSKSCSIRINAASVPTIGTVTATENNTKVKAKGENITVQSISSKTITCTASAANGATVKSVTLNGNIQLKNTSGNTWSVTAGNPQNGSYLIEATDSRGKKSSTLLTQTFYEYSRPAFTVSTLKRENETSANGTLTVAGTYSPILANTVTMTIQRLSIESAATRVYPTISNGKVNLSKSYTDLSYVSSWSIRVIMTDSFGESATTTATCGVGKYSFAIAKEGIVITDKSKVLLTDTMVIESLIDFIFPVGICMQFANEFDPNEHWKGTTWERVEGRYFYNTPYSGGGPLLSTFGDGWSRAIPYHTLTQGQMPIHYHPQYVSANYGSGGPGVRRDFIDEGGGLSAYAQGISTGGAGGNESHSHGSIDISPPSLRVRGWRRTA